MASEYYGKNRGQHEQDIVFATSTNSTDIEVRIDATKAFTVAEVKDALDEIYNQIIRNNKWQPA